MKPSWKDAPEWITLEILRRHYEEVDKMIRVLQQHRHFLNRALSALEKQPLEPRPEAKP